MADGLGLAHERILVVPGNHDVNRKKCQAYFLDQESEGLQPVAPYWPKWAPYAAMYSRLDGGAEFPRDQPWSHAEFPDLRLAVAGLNSTIAESHRDDDHYGRLGEEQLRYFAERMAAAGAAGWLAASRGAAPQSGAGHRS